MTELIAGRIDVSYTAIGFAKPHINSGAAKALAVSGQERSPLLPNVPSLGELGLEFPYQGAWFAMMAPPGTDAVVLGRIAAAVKDVLNDPEYRTNFLIPQGYEAVGNTPAEFAANLRVDTLAGATLSKLVPAKAPN